VQSWDEYSTHAGDAGVVTTTLWCRQLAQQSGGAQLLSIVDHQLVHYFGLYRTRSAHSRTIGFAVLLVLRRFYCFVNNIAPIPRPINNIIHAVHALSLTYGKSHLTGGGVWSRGFLTMFFFNKWGHLTGGAIDRGHLTVHLSAHTSDSNSAGVISTNVGADVTVFEHKQCCSLSSELHCLYKSIVPTPGYRPTLLTYS